MPLQGRYRRLGCLRVYDDGGARRKVVDAAHGLARLEGDETVGAALGHERGLRMATTHVTCN